MKRFLPLLAMSAMFIAAPAFAQDAVTADSDAPQVIAQVPSSAAVVAGERPRMNLSDSQLEQLRALKDRYFADTAVKKAQLSVLKHSLRSALTAENVDKNGVMSLQAQINAMQADLNNARISQVLDAQSVFTPDQRKMMHSRMLHGGFGGGRGHHGGWGHGGGCGGERGHGGPGGEHRFGGHHGFGGPGGHGGPGPGAHAMEGPAPDADLTAQAPEAPDFGGMTAQVPPMDGPEFDGE